VADKANVYVTNYTRLHQEMRKKNWKHGPIQFVKRIQNDVQEDAIRAVK